MFILYSREKIIVIGFVLKKLLQKNNPEGMQPNCIFDRICRNLILENRPILAMARLFSVSHSFREESFLPPLDHIQPSGTENSPATVKSNFFGKVEIFEK